MARDEHNNFNNTIIYAENCLFDQNQYKNHAPPKKKNKGNVEDDPFDFKALSSMKQVTPTKPAGNRIDVEVTQAASERVFSSLATRKPELKWA